MARSNDPLGGFGGRIARNFTNRLVSRLIGLAVAALLAGVGLNQCGKTKPAATPTQEATTIINVNIASVEELMTLPRINESLARRIVAGRPYAKVDDLEKVMGIGPKTLEAMRPRVTVGQSPAGR